MRPNILTNKYLFILEGVKDEYQRNEYQQYDYNQYGRYNQYEPSIKRMKTNDHGIKNEPITKQIKSNKNNDDEWNWDVWGDDDQNVIKKEDKKDNKMFNENRNIENIERNKKSEDNDDIFKEDIFEGINKIEQDQEIKLRSTGYRLGGNHNNGSVANQNKLNRNNNNNEQDDEEIVLCDGNDVVDISSDDDDDKTNKNFEISLSSQSNDINNVYKSDQNTKVSSKWGSYL